jgi:hypothetical protein
MNQSSGFTWTNTSQWSQLPTVPANTQTDNTAQPQSGQSLPPSSSYTPPQSSNYTPQPQYGTQSSFNPETRRDMVTRLYKAILGREPDTAGLNYYLFNTSITEGQIAREMYESTEHQEVLTKAKDVRTMILKFEELNHKVGELEIKLQNSESIAKNYKSLLDQKAAIINQLMASNGTGQQSPVTTAPQVQEEPIQLPQESSYSSQLKEEEYGIVLEDPFAEDSNKSKKGCLGTIKGWFKFD